MNTNTMLKSKWYLVEIFTAKKAFRITVRKPLDTKAEALTFENSRVKAHNHKSLLKLISEGYTDLNLVNDTKVETVEEITPQPIVEAVKPIETKQEFNPEVEEAIRQNYIKAKEKKGIEFVKGASIKEVSKVEAEYFAKLTQSKSVRKENEFQKTYDSKWNSYYEKRNKEIEKEKESCEVIL